MDDTVDALRRAVDCLNRGRLDEAGAILQQVLERVPGHPDATHLRGIVAAEQGDFRLAEKFLSEAVRVAPGIARFQNGLGICLERQGRAHEALAAFDRSVVLDPIFAVGHFNRGNVLKKLGALTDALAAYDRALRIAPNYAEAMNNRGDLLASLGRLDDALAACDGAIRLKPNLAKAHINRGNVLARMGKQIRALAAYEEAIRLDANNAEAWGNHAGVLRDLGEMERVEADYRRSLELDPVNAGMHSNLVFLETARDGITPERLFKVQREWSERHGEAGRRVRYSRREPSADASVPLRIGYVSPDFRRHPVSIFMEPILVAHDARRVEVFCYDVNAGPPDAITKRLRGIVPNWRNAVGMSDRELADTIHADEIDVLVDLAGHTANNRLPVFACKPAPVQAAYLGFFGGTGLAEIDYWITDEVLHPPDTSEKTVESIYRLPRCAFCFLPPADAPPVAPCPNTDDQVTFGSFNHLSKLTPRVVEAWSRILSELPGSRLLLMYRPGGDPVTDQLLAGRFADHGIGAEQLIFRGNAPFKDYLATYAEVDIVLDTFPRTGGTTTAQALWMGVPVVTLAGERYAGRISASKLVAIGADELVAASVDEYIEKVIALARDPERRVRLRDSLRERMMASPLCDGRGLARALETAYRQMWEKYLATR